MKVELLGHTLGVCLISAKLFHSICIILYSHQQDISITVGPSPWQHLTLSVFLILVIQVGMKWYLIRVLLCISQLTNEVEDLAICLSTISLSFMKCFNLQLIFNN